MDRTTFLRSMLGNAALLTLPPLELLPVAEQDRLAWTKDANAVFVFDTYVRGFQHYEGPRVLCQMKDLDVLDLVREYANAHDTNAVAVYWEGHKVGYLPMGENVSLAYMMDHGLLLECHVVYTQPKERHWEQCFIAVELLIPSTPSFDAYMDHYMDRPDAGYKRRPEYGGSVVVDELQAKTGPRELRQAPALSALGDLRLMRLLAFLSSGMEWSPYVVKQVQRAVERKGIGVLTELMDQGDLRLALTVVAADHFLVELNMRGPEGRTGGHWEVVYNAAHEVLRADMRGFSTA
ncbi:MAG: HIRAN domain-containing protein [Flavobacteriales bacterium]|nr:HIRAN domain-containing protein [Flavobacteriales bacterium]